MFGLLALLFYVEAIAEICNHESTSDSNCVTPLSMLFNYIKQELPAIYGGIDGHDHELTNSTLICGESILNIVNSYTFDAYFAPNVLAQLIGGLLNNHRGACLGKTSKNAIRNLLKEVTNPDAKVYTSVGCSNGFDEYKKELDSSSMSKALGRTLYLYNNGQNYGPKSC
jgi:hypothetical protein